MELFELKSFLRVDGDEDDALIVALQSAAEEYCKNAGVPVDYGNALYCLAVQMLVTHWYENRSPVDSGSVSKVVELSLVNILTQLRFTKGATS